MAEAHNPEVSIFVKIMANQIGSDDFNASDWSATQ